MVSCSLVELRAKERRQALTADAQDGETLVEFVVVAIVRIRDVKVLSVIKEIAPEDDLSGGSIQSAPYVVSVLTGHHDDEVLTA